MTTEQAKIEGAWLLDVKVGDRVWVGRKRYSDGSGMNIETVTERTKTEIRVGHRKFRVKAWGDGSLHANQLAAGMLGAHIGLCPRKPSCPNIR